MVLVTHQRSSTAVHEVRLNLPQRAEVERACTRVRRSGTPLIAVRHGQFPLPTLGLALENAAQAVDNGSGHVVVHGLPVADPRQVLWGVGLHLGVAVSQNTTGHLVRAVQDDSTYGVGGSDVTVLLAVDDGAAVSLVDSRRVYDAALRLRPDLADRWHVRVPVSLADETGYHLVPLACQVGARISVRYDRYAIERAQRHPGVPILTDAHRDLLDLVDSLLPRYAREIRLEAGDLLLLNNHERMHRVDAGATPLLRLWLTLRVGRPLPTGYIWQTPTLEELPGRGGVSPLDEIRASTRPRVAVPRC